MTREEAIWYLQPIADSASLPRYAEALNMAIAALREQEERKATLIQQYIKVPEKPQWISVEERLPEPYKNVLVWRDNYLDDSGCVGIDFTFTFNGGDVEWADHMRTWKSVVTHWMPLPEPPKEEV